MKKENNKGFTLVELLAVIIILAIVVGITVPAVLTTINNTRKKSFNVAVRTIQDYIQRQYDMTNLTEEFRGNNYDEKIATANCNNNECQDKIDDNEDTNVLTATGYAKNISEIAWTVENGRVKIKCATALEDGDYIQGEEYSICLTKQTIDKPISAGIQPVKPRIKG